MPLDALQPTKDELLKLHGQDCLTLKGWLEYKEMTDDDYCIFSWKVEFHSPRQYKLTIHGYSRTYRCDELTTFWGSKGCKHQQ